MFRNILVVSILILSVISGTFYGKQQDFQKNGVEYFWEKEPENFTSKEVYLSAFMKSYSQIPLDVLGKSSRDEMQKWLQDSFEEVYFDFKDKENKLWLSAKVDNKIVGFLVVETTNFPKEIYLAQLAIEPKYQGRGIASTMIRSLFDQFSECERFVVITRSANQEANKFYKALGFSPSLYMHEGYSSKMYTGYEYVNYPKNNNK